MTVRRLTKEDVAEAARMKRSGVMHKDIAAYIGVSEYTFSRWLNHPKTENQRQLAQAMKKAEVKRKQNLLAVIQRASVEGKNPSWQAAAWLLERQYPDEFGRRDRAPAAPEKAEVPAFYDSREEAERG